MLRTIESLGHILPSRATRFLAPGSSAARFLRPVFNRVLPDHEIPVTVLGGPAQGIKLIINPRREKYFWTGMHEPHVQQRIVDLLSDGCVFWDIGAYIGMMSLLASRQVGKQGQVHAFEPVQENARRLRRAIDLNDADVVTVHDTAVGFSSGVVPIFSRSESAMWSLNNSGQGTSSLNVECTTLDILVEQIGWPDLVKIDTEGAELEVLQGGSRLIAARRTTFLVEFTDQPRIEMARALCVDHDFTLLGSNHWLITPQKQ